MIEQIGNKLVLTFPTADSAQTFSIFLASLLQPASQSPSQSPDLSEEQSHVQNASSELPSEALPIPAEIPAFPEPSPFRSQHVVLTPERQEELFNRRQQGMTTHQRVLRAQTTLRDGVLPFSKPGQMPEPSGQPSPRIRAQKEGGFADGVPVARPQARHSRREKAG